MCNQQSLRSACAYTQSDQSLCWSLEYSMNVKLLTEHHLEFLRLKGGCTGSSESTLVKCHIAWNHMSRLKSLVSNSHLYTLRCVCINITPCLPVTVWSGFKLVDILIVFLKKKIKSFLPIDGLHHFHQRTAKRHAHNLPRMHRAEVDWIAAKNPYWFISLT